MGEIREPKGDPIAISSDKGKADALNAFFATTFTDEDTEFIPRIQPKHTGETLTSISISEDEVYKKLVSLSKYKSSGPDGIHPCVLKSTAASVSEPLALIYNTSLKDGKLPSAWKASHVVPVHKIGSKVDVRNYRPMSTVPCKVLESLI